MGSTTSRTPSRSMTVSSSASSSSKVKPYWKPEHPPPVTNTRRLRRSLPSSSISERTLPTALSLNCMAAGVKTSTLDITTSGGGAAAHQAGYYPFIRLFWSTTLEFPFARQLDPCSGATVTQILQLAIDLGASHHLHEPVIQIAINPRLGIQLQVLIGIDIADDGSINHHLRRLDDAFDITITGNTDHTLGGVDIANHPSVHLHRTAESDIPTQLCISGDHRGLAGVLTDGLALALVFQHQDRAPVSVHSNVCSSSTLPSCSTLSWICCGSKPS